MPPCRNCPKELATNGDLCWTCMDQQVRNVLPDRRDIEADVKARAAAKAAEPPPIVKLAAKQRREFQAMMRNPNPNRRGW